MKNIAIIGAGGFGREIAWLIHQLPEWNLIGFFDDNPSVAQHHPKTTLLGNINEVKNISTDVSLVVAISDPVIRQSIVNLLPQGFQFPTLIHPKADVGCPQNKIGKGAIIAQAVIITTNVSIGDFSIINLQSIIGHDTVVSPFASIMPQASISGNVKLGARCFVGVGAKILQGLTLGDDCIVGSGAVVTKSYGNNIKLTGVPAVVA